MIHFFSILTFAILLLFLGEVAVASAFRVRARLVHASGDRATITKHRAPKRTDIALSKKLGEPRNGPYNKANKTMRDSPRYGPIRSEPVGAPHYRVLDLWLYAKDGVCVLRALASQQRLSLHQLKDKLPSTMKASIDIWQLSGYITNAEIAQILQLILVDDPSANPRWPNGWEYTAFPNLLAAAAALQAESQLCDGRYIATFEAAEISPGVKVSHWVCLEKLSGRVTVIDNYPYQVASKARNHEGMFNEHSQSPQSYVHDAVRAGVSGAQFGRASLIYNADWDL